jgi:hypothetical protein
MRCITPLRLRHRQLGSTVQTIGSGVVFRCEVLNEPATTLAGTFNLTVQVVGVWTPALCERLVLEAFALAVPIRVGRFGNVQSRVASCDFFGERIHVRLD